MTIWKLMPEDIEAVVNQLKGGRTYEEVAKDLGISVEMVTCAERKWSAMPKRLDIWA